MPLTSNQSLTANEYALITPTDIVKEPLSDSSKLPQLWNDEYTSTASIPSSHRNEPAHALVELLNRFDIKGQDSLDLGCGNGRNAFFLAENGMRVTAIDFSEAALGILRSALSKHTDPKPIVTMNHDLHEGLPFEDSSFEFILDSYCLCHFVDHIDHAKVMKECNRVLKSKGIFVLIHLDDRDEYYIERMQEKTEFGHISFDPANGIKKLHCNARTYSHLFAKDFLVKESFDVQFVDKVRGKNYMRSIFVSVMQKE